ncbi:hypothetical protein LXL04_002980 [Taraxacum kok-saghyz]
MLFGPRLLKSSLRLLAVTSANQFKSLVSYTHCGFEIDFQQTSSKTSASYISKPVQEFGVLYTLWFRNRFPDEIHMADFHFIGLKTISKDYSPFLQRGGMRMVHPEELSFFDTDSGIPHHRFDAFGSRHHRHLRHRLLCSNEIYLWGGRLDHDRYRDWRLDVDTMSYKELLELGDKIGYVSTGLREDEIGCCVRKTKPPNMSDCKSSPHFPNEMQWKCTICQVSLAIEIKPFSTYTGIIYKSTYKRYSSDINL